MKRKHFLLIAAIIPGIFGLVMMFAPDVMLSNSLSTEITKTTRIVTQWVGLEYFLSGVLISYRGMIRVRRH